MLQHFKTIKSITRELNIILGRVNSLSTTISAVNSGVSRLRATSCDLDTRMEAVERTQGTMMLIMMGKPRRDAHDAKRKQESAMDTQVGGSHYKDFAIQPADFIHSNGIGYIPGNVIKYVCRYDKKNGVEDLKKARHYLDMLIEMEQNKANEKHLQNT